MSKYDELREAAKTATQGTWLLSLTGQGGAYPTAVVSIPQRGGDGEEYDDYSIGPLDIDLEDLGDKKFVHDVTFIAAANPQVILQLIDDYDKLTAFSEIQSKCIIDELKLTKRLREEMAHYRNKVLVEMPLLRNKLETARELLLNARISHASNCDYRQGGLCNCCVKRIDMFIKDDK